MPVLDVNKDPVTDHQESWASCMDEGELEVGKLDPPYFSSISLCGRWWAPASALKQMERRKV